MSSIKLMPSPEELAMAIKLLAGEDSKKIFKTGAELTGEYRTPAFAVTAKEAVDWYYEPDRKQIFFNGSMTSEKFWIVQPKAEPFECTKDQILVFQDKSTEYTDAWRTLYAGLEIWSRGAGDHRSREWKKFHLSLPEAHILADSRPIYDIAFVKPIPKEIVDTVTEENLKEGFFKQNFPYGARVVDFREPKPGSAEGKREWFVMSVGDVVYNGGARHGKRWILGPKPAPEFVETNWTMDQWLKVHGWVEFPCGEFLKVTAVSESNVGFGSVRYQISNPELRKCKVDGAFCINRTPAAA